MVLYLPRNYSTLPREQVMVGQQGPQRPPMNQLASGHALMSLLREGGQWDDEDDARARMTQTDDIGALEPPKTWSLGSKLDDERWENAGEYPPPALPSVVSRLDYVYWVSAETRLRTSRHRLVSAAYADVYC